MDKPTADIICRALLAIVAALQRKYNLPSYRNINLIVTDFAGVTQYEKPTQTEN